MGERDAFDRTIADWVERAAVPPSADGPPRVQEAASRGRRIRRRRRYVAVAATVLAGAAVPGVTFAAIRALQSDGPTVVTPADPTRLLGTFSTDMPSGRSAGAALAGHWTFVLRGNGTIGVQPPPGYGGVVTGSDFQTTGDVVRLNLFVQDLCSSAPVGRYRWARDAAGLHFTVLTDDCAPRRLLLDSAAWRPGI
jgi:hypothetical protein